MPVYDYKCAEHGFFYELVSMDDAAKPCACPTCGALSGRVIMLAPEFLGMKAENRQAHGRNEEARHRPKFSTVESRLEEKARREHKHGKGCGCGDRPIRQSKLWFTADGKKMFPSMRPWMISH